MYCSNCAAELDAGLYMCPRCGRSVEAVPQASSLPAVATRPGVVSVAVILFLISVASGPLSLLVTFARLRWFLPLSYVIQSLGFDALWIVTILFLWKGHPQARIAILILTVATIVSIFTMYSPILGFPVPKSLD